MAKESRMVVGTVWMSTPQVVSVLIADGHVHWVPSESLGGKSGRDFPEGMVVQLSLVYNEDAFRLNRVVCIFPDGGPAASDDNSEAQEDSVRV